MIDYNQLRNVFTHFSYLDNALNFVTIQQILGLDSKPMLLSEIKTTNGNLGKYIGSFGSGRGQFDDYITTTESTTDKKTFKITHLKNKGIFEAISITLKEDSLKDFDEIKKGISPIKFVHDWHIIKHSNGRILYCPELKNIIQETHQLKVPEKILELELSNFLFYKEMKFARFLIENACPIDRFRALPGMSENKLKLLSENQYVVEELIAKGIQIEEFASINDLRLENVVTNYNKVRHALELVPISQIVNFPRASIIRSESTPTESMEEEKPKQMRYS